MKQHRLTILFLAAIVSMAVNGQLFHSLGLGIEIPGDMVGDWYQPQMHIEGDILYVCTTQGLYSKDLSNEGSEWQLVGFEGIPLQDYVRRGEDILALRHCYYVHSEFLLLSHDGGKTYKDITPDFFKGRGYAFLSLEQHPADPNTLLTSSSSGCGILLTTDFGQTWEKLADFTPVYTGFHPLNPEIIYECGGGGYTDEKTDIRISYDGGQTWEEKAQCFSNYNTVFRMAFHPADLNKWIAGGYHCVHSTNDTGQSWNTQHLRDYDNPLNEDYMAPWRYAAYDNENPDIVYMASSSYNGYMKLMCSTDGGETWNRPYMEPIKTTPTEYVFDMKQYGDKLLIYSQSDVYMVSKAELIEHKTSVQINETNFPDEYFRTWVLAQPYGQDGVLTDEEIMYVTTINLMGKRIQNLKGIEHFTELTTLYCTGNQLTELDVSECTKLTHLECDWNQLTALDVSENTALTVLICGANKLTTLDVSNNTALNELHCFKNQLTELDVSNNVELTNLNCHENQLTALDLSNNTMLEDVWCSQNQLVTLNVSACAMLRYLRCYENRLTMLDVSGCSALKDLICMNNQIKGEAMDALVESLPTVGRGGSLGVINHVNEQNVMTKSQVAAAKAKGWYVHYYNDKNQWENYEGIDDPVTYTEGQMATIILPTEPDASKGKYYRLDRVEEGKIIFEQELQPRAHVPYIIVPNEDFSIDLNNMDLEGCSPDTVSIEVRFEGQAESQSIYFIGSYVSEELEQQEGYNIQLIDTTPDCCISFSEETGKETFLIGALRAYLTWDDPYNQGGTKGRGDKLEIVLRDYGTDIKTHSNSPLKGENKYDLSGKKLSDKPAHGLYIENGKKQAVR